MSGVRGCRGTKLYESTRVRSHGTQRSVGVGSDQSDASLSCQRQRAPPVTACGACAKVLPKLHHPAGVHLPAPLVQRAAELNRGPNDRSSKRTSELSARKERRTPAQPTIQKGRPSVITIRPFVNKCKHCGRGELSRLGVRLSPLEPLKRADQPLQILLYGELLG